MKGFAPPIWWIAAALAASLVVVAMGTLAAPFGSELSGLEAPSGGEELTRLLQQHGAVIRTTLALDYLFIGLYATTFWGLYLWVRDQDLARLALGLALLTAVWDVSENTLLFSLASQGSAVTDDLASLVVALSSAKWATAAAAVLLFAVGLISRGVAGWIIAGTGFAFALATALSLFDIGGDTVVQARLLLMPLVLLVTAGMALYLRWADRTRD